LVAVALGCACGPAAPPLALPEGCQPLLGGADCLLPYPSDYFRVADAAQPSGAKLALTDAAKQKTKQGVVVDTTASLPIDGPSRSPTLITLLGSPVSPDGFVRLEQGGTPSLSADTSHTLLLEADTGAPVAHFVDLDPRATDPGRQALVLHPFVRLKAQTRYVALVHGATTPDGAPATPPEGFRRLRDRLSRGDPQLEPLQAHFDAAIFPVAEAAGVPRAEVQLAWDFTTGSDEWATRDLLAVREQTMAWLSANTPVVTVDEVVDAPADKPEIFRVVRGHVTGPRFVDSPNPGAKLTRDAQGHVVQTGTVDFPFSAVLPVSVRDASGASGVFVFGHGFFGNLGEIEDSAVRGLAQEAGRTAIGTEWWGMHVSDIAKVGDALTSRPGQAMQFVERVHQAMANFMVLSAAVKPMRALPAFQRAGGEALLAGDVADGFIGISQGHVLGGTFAAVNPTTTRAVLMVGGAGLTGLMMRSTPFSGYFALLDLSLSDPLEQQKYLATLQRPLDRIDPATWAVHLLDSPLPGNPDKRVLMQVGLMDNGVPNVGTFYHARLAGLPVLAPSPRVPWGLEEAPGPLTSALAVYDFQLGDVDAFYRAADFSPETTIVHEAVRRLPAAKRQVSKFLSTGLVTNECDGVCDPE
jgi:hypothetical protein